MQIDDIVREAASRRPDGLALVTEAGGETFAELDREVDGLAARVLDATDPGDRVAVLSENRAEYVHAYYGVPRAGRILVPLNHRLHPEEWASALGRSGARMLLAEPDLLDRLRPVLADRTAPDRTPPDRTSIETVDLSSPGLLSEERIPLPSAQTGAGVGGAGGQAGVSGAGGRAGVSGAGGAGGVAWLVGTSGTTGTPKLAMLTHASLLAAVDATLGARPVGDDDVLLTPFPLCHVAGYNVLVLHRRARPLVLMRRFDPVGLARLVREHRVTMLSLAPTMISMLLDHAAVEDGDLATVRALGYGASPIPGPVLRRVVERWDWDCSQGYGMTELSGNAVFLGPDDHRAGAAGDERLLHAAGRPAPGVEVRLAPAGAEILVRAPQVMAGYWQEPTATAQALRDGWLHTGDVGRIDADGLISIVDRAKDVIVSGGENVASREVEEVLHRHPAVADVAVIGLPDERWGERVCAVVVVRPGAVVTAEELVDLARAHLAGFKAPREVRFLAELPRNASGKVLKHRLREDLRPPPE